MKMKHTQGPWSVVTNNAYQTSWLIMDSNGNQLAQVANYQNVSRNVDAEENAKLMARAPELLERIATLEREKEMLRDALSNLLNTSVVNKSDNDFTEIVCVNEYYEAAYNALPNNTEDDE